MAKPRTPRSTARRVPRSDRLSPAAENYLLSLYILWEEGVRVTLAQLADSLKRLPEGEHLGTSLPSVAGMVRRLEREELVSSDLEKEIRLTERGFVRAEDMVRRHRLAERLVVDVLGVELPRAHMEAHRLEHAISSELLAKIAERLHNPETCPFGRPIPGSGYQPPPTPTLPLDRALPGVPYLVDRIPEEDEELVRFLVAQGLLPGEAVTVREAAAYRGVITLEVGGRQASLGYQIAAGIRVRPA